jgi:hypothetical protein
LHLNKIRSENLSSFARALSEIGPVVRMEIFHLFISLN